MCFARTMRFVTLLAGLDVGGGPECRHVEVNARAQLPGLNPSPLAPGEVN